MGQIFLKKLAIKILYLCPSNDNLRAKSLFFPANNPDPSLFKRNKIIYFRKCICYGLHVACERFIFTERKATRTKPTASQGQGVLLLVIFFLFFLWIYIIGSIIGSIKYLLHARLSHINIWLPTPTSKNVKH